MGRLERDIRAVTIIPGASEHGYDPAVVRETTGDGAGRLITATSSMPAATGRPRSTKLQALCPNLERVALVVAWFGTDLRAERLHIRPGVEVRERRDESRNGRWQGSTGGPHLVMAWRVRRPMGARPSDAGRDGGDR